MTTNFGKQVLKPCKYGWMLYSPGSPHIGKCFDFYGQYSESEVEIFRQYIPEGATSLDIGANIGSLTIPMALLCGDSGAVYAIESHIENYYTLCSNLSLNEQYNTKAINAFVSDSDAAQPTGSVWGSFISNKWGAPVVAVDQLGLDRCDFIKIDVDGGEINVLKSAKDTIKKYRPILYVENDQKERSEALIDYLFSIKYDVYFHMAPIIDKDNYFGRTENLWHPRNICSLMMLCIPRERDHSEVSFRRVTDAKEWFELS